MNEKSFTQAVETHKNAVYGYAVHQVGNLDDAADITQETFVALWRERDRIPAEAQRAWLLRVCRNACLDLHRRRAVRSRSAAAVRTGAAVAPRLGGDGDASGNLAREATDRGAHARRVELGPEVARVVEMMQALPEPARSVIMLREIYDLTYQEISQVLEMPMSSVKVTLHRARRRVREAIGPVK